MVIPTVADFPFKRDLRKKLTCEIEDRLHALLSIAGMSGCCQVLDCIYCTLIMKAVACVEKKRKSKTSMHFAVKLHMAVMVRLE